jgi:hypothetical protein
MSKAQIGILVCVFLIVTGFVWHLIDSNTQDVSPSFSSPTIEGALEERSSAGKPSLLPASPSVSLPSVSAPAPVHGPCHADKEKFCKEAKGRNLKECLQAHHDKLTKACLESIEGVSPAP